MNISNRWYCWGVLLSALCQPALVPAIGQETEGISGQIAEGFEGLSTLESVRANSSQFPEENSDAGMGPGMGMGMPGAMGMGPGMMPGTPPSAKQLLLQHINQLRQRLSAPNQHREQLEPMLRDALAEYFVLDMQERVREFDKIKARVVQMESKLQTRLDRRREILELQLKQMLYDADGLDFSIPGNTADEGGMGGYGGGGMMGGMMGAGGGGMIGGPMGSMGSGMMSGGMGGYGEMGSSGLAGGSSDSGAFGAIPEKLGYDLRFGTTRYVRFPDQPLGPSDPLASYVSLDGQSEQAQQIADLDSSASDATKMKALLLAMHKFNILFSHFPASANRRAINEKPHSWRVALLPLLGHADLYKQYHFDEPWDSQHNLTLVNQMPSVFASKDDADAMNGSTRFQMLVGNGAAFDPARPTAMQDITDGTSNTIALAIASTSVPWTQPEDIQFTPNASLAKLAASRLVGMCDGVVHKLPSNTSEQQLTIFATRSGGEIAPEILTTP